MKKIMIALAGLAFAGLAACSGLNKATAPYTGVEVVDVYEGVDGFAENAYVTIRLYEASLDAAIWSCDIEANPKAADTPDEACEAAADAAERITPAVEAVSHSIGTYVYFDKKVDEIRADGEVVPEEILDRASEAYFKARSEWGDVQADIAGYLNK